MRMVECGQCGHTVLIYRGEKYAICQFCGQAFDCEKEKSFPAESVRKIGKSIYIEKVNPHSISYEKIVDEFNDIGTTNVIRPEDLNKVFKAYKKQMDIYAALDMAGVLGPGKRVVVKPSLEMHERPEQTSECIREGFEDGLKNPIYSEQLKEKLNIEPIFSQEFIEDVNERVRTAMDNIRKAVEEAYPSDNKLKEKILAKVDKEIFMDILQEECGELIVAASKVRRVAFTPELNPTNQSLEDARNNFIEEVADVMNCIDLLITDPEDWTKIDEIMRRKRRRWLERLNETQSKAEDPDREGK